MQAAYKRIHGREMHVDVRGDTSGSYGKLLVALVENERDDKQPVRVCVCV